MENLRIRKAARTADVPFWKIADALGISEPTMTRWMRKPLDTEKEKLILDAIRELEQDVRL